MNEMIKLITLLHRYGIKTVQKLKSCKLLSPFKKHKSNILKGKILSHLPFLLGTFHKFSRILLFLITDSKVQ